MTPDGKQNGDAQAGGPATAEAHGSSPSSASGQTADKRNRAPAIPDKTWQRDQILSATRGLISEHGYPNVTMRQIAKRAGVSVGLIYKRFPEGKPAIVHDLFERSVGALLEPALAERSPVADVPGLVRELLDALVANHREHRALNAALEAAYLAEPKLQAHFNALLADDLAAVGNLLARLDDAGQIDFPAPTRHGFFLVQMIDAFIHRHVIHDILKVSDAEFVDFLTTVVLRVVGHPPS